MNNAEARTTETCPVCGAPLAPGASACGTCGFKLLGSTQAFTPLSVDAPASTPQADTSLLEEAVFRIVRGPQTGASFRLAAPKISMGRSPRCDIFLNDMTVSREHATLERSGAGYRIVDNDSFNGLWVNNINVKEAELRDGDVVQIGTFCLVYLATPAV